MKARLLNFLACPHDQHAPLKLHSFRERPTPVTKPFSRCELHCGLRDSSLATVTLDDCQRCADTEIDEGVLACPQCGRWYPVTDGLPTLFPDDLRPADLNFIAMHREGLSALGLVTLRFPTEREATASADAIARMQRERQARDDQAERYDQMWGLRLYKAIEAPAYFNALRAAPRGPLFEAGGGTGRLTDIFTALSDEVITADFSLTSLRRNRRRHAASGRIIHYLQCDLTRLPLRDHCVTAIAHAGVYEHIPTQDLRRRWLEHARRALAPGGQFMVSAYRYGGVMKLFGKAGEHPGGIPFIRFTEAELRAELGHAFVVQEFTRSLGLYLSLATCMAKP